MGNFDWQSAEQHEWQAGEQSAGGSGRRWTPWKIALVVSFVTIGAGGLTLYIQAHRALRQAEQTLRQSAALIVESSAAGDNDLFKSLVSGRDRGWATTVLSVNHEGGFFSRRPSQSPGDDPPLILTSISPRSSPGRLSRPESPRAALTNSIRR